MAGGEETEEARTAPSAVQPRTRHAPAVLHLGGRDPHHLRRLVDVQPAEKTQLHGARLFRIEGCQPVHGHIQLENVLFPIDDAAIGGGLKCDGPRISAAFEGVLVAVMIHQNAAHQIGRRSEEVRTVLPCK